MITQRRSANLLALGWNKPRRVEGPVQRRGSGSSILRNPPPKPLTPIQIALVSRCLPNHSSYNFCPPPAPGGFRPRTQKLAFTDRRIETNLGLNGFVAIELWKENLS